MKRKTWVILSLGLGLILALGGGLATSSGQVLAQAQDGVVQEESGLQGAVGTSFTYQGRLLHNGTPINSTCDLEFTLWDAASGGTQQGLQTANGVQVSDGYLSAELDFGSGAFRGDARYLQIRVNCGQGNALLQPRQSLTAVPYAHSLRPGASVESFSGTALSLSAYTTTGAALNASVTAPTGNAAAVYGSSSSPGGAGLSGYNAGGGSGVYGAAGGNTGTPYGVYGVASHGGTTTSYGVYGKSNSSVGTGVGGESPRNGVFGKATADNGQGVRGEATSSNGTTYGVYGKANSPWGYGIYSEGNAYVDGDLSWKAKTGYVAVPASAFHPIEDGYDFVNDGIVLVNLDGASIYYVASVQLPHHATVTKLTFYWADGSMEDGDCELRWSSLEGYGGTMAVAYTSGSAYTADSSEAASIDPDYATVDNSRFAYPLFLYLPDSDVVAHGAVIEYTFHEPVLGQGGE